MNSTRTFRSGYNVMNPWHDMLPSGSAVPQMCGSRLHRKKNCLLWCACVPRSTGRCSSLAMAPISYLQTLVFVAWWRELRSVLITLKSEVMAAP